MALSEAVEALIGLALHLVYRVRSRVSQLLIDIAVTVFFRIQLRCVGRQPQWLKFVVAGFYVAAQEAFCAVPKSWPGALEN